MNAEIKKQIAIITAEAQMRVNQLVPGLRVTVLVPPKPEVSEEELVSAGARRPTSSWP
jgi:hypothetical protein